MSYKVPASIVISVVVGMASACRERIGPGAPQENPGFIGHDADADVLSDSNGGTTTKVDATDVVIEAKSDSEVVTDVKQDSSAGSQKPSPVPTPTPSTFYPNSCADIKKFDPNAKSGNHKIYLNAASPSRKQIDATCDMLEGNGAWTLVANYLHKGNTNPPASIRTSDLPLIGGDIMGVDESTLAKNWGHAGAQLLSGFKVNELRFFCRSSENNRVVHFKTNDPNCIKSAQTGVGNCLGINTSYVLLTEHTGILPIAMNAAKGSIQPDLAMTQDTFGMELPQVNDITWNIGVNGAWECDFGSNDSTHDTLHRIWFQ